MDRLVESRIVFRSWSVKWEGSNVCHWPDCKIFKCLHLHLQTRIKFEAMNLQSFKSSSRDVAMDIGYVLKSLQPHKAKESTVKACLRMRSLSSPIACLVAACCLHGRVHGNVLQKDTIAILQSTVYLDAENTIYLYLLLQYHVIIIYIYCSTICVFAVAAAWNVGLADVCK